MVDFLEAVNHYLNRHHFLPKICLLVNAALALVAVWLVIFSNDTKHQPTVVRLLFSVLITVLLTAHGYRQKSVSLSGMITGALIAFTMFLTQWTIAIALLVCFLATTRSTRFREDIKRRFEANFKAGGQRNWLQIVCNLGVANVATLVLLITSGIGAEAEVDFTTDFRRSWCLLSALGAISCALSDTLSSELGPVLGPEDIQPVLITSFRTVPKGTNGGITIGGLVAAAVGGALVGTVAWISQSFTSSSSSLSSSNFEAAHQQWHSPQWPLVLFCLYAGLLGSLLDSLLGATLQYTGYDHLRRRIVEDPPGSKKNDDDTSISSTTFVEHISGRPVLDNHDVNLLSILAMALVTPSLASLFWPAGVAESGDHLSFQKRFGLH